MSANTKTSTSSAGFVLDSYAIMAYLKDEPGADRVQELLLEADASRVSLHMCLVNYGEVLYVTERRWGQVRLQRVMARVEGWPLVIEPVDRRLVKQAAHLKAHYPISYADSFAVALAQMLDMPVVTGDPEFANLDAEVGIEWLVPRPV